MKKIGIFRLARGNLRRKYMRTLLLFLIVAVVTGTLLGAGIFITGMKNALRIGTYRLGADVLVVPAENETQARSALLSGEPTSFFMGREVLDLVRSVEGVKKAAPQLFIKPTSFTCCYNVEAFLVAFDPGSDFTVIPWVGQKLKKPLAEDEIMTGSALPVLPGDTLPFFGTPFNVVGTMEPTGMKFFDQSVFMTLNAAYRMSDLSKTESSQPLDLDKNRISAVLVQVREDISPDRVAIRIEHAVEGVKAIASDEVISTVRRQLNGLMKAIFAISAVVWILALLMMGFSFYMIVNERRREIGLLRAMGARRGHVFGLILAEAVMISLGGGVIGMIAGASLLFAFQNILAESLKLPYLLPSFSILAELIAGALLFAVMTGVLSSLLPAASAGRMEPYEAVRQGE